MVHMRSAISANSPGVDTKARSAVLSLAFCIPVLYTTLMKNTTLIDTVAAWEISRTYMSKPPKRAISLDQRYSQVARRGVSVPPRVMASRGDTISGREVKAARENAYVPAAVRLWSLDSLAKKPRTAVQLMELMERALAQGLILQFVPSDQAIDMDVYNSEEQIGSLAGKDFAALLLDGPEDLIEGDL